MKSKEFSNKTSADLNKILGEKKEALRVFRFGAAGSKTKNVKQGREIRKDIARIMTSLSTLKRTSK